MVDKSQSFRRGREFTHELVVLKKSKSSSFNSLLVDDRKYTSLKPIRSQTASNYEQPISTEVATLSVDKRQSPTEERKDVELEPEKLTPLAQGKEDVELEKPKRLSLKIAKCTRHAYVTIITTVVLGILLLGTLVLAVLALSLAKADNDMLQMMTQQMVEKVRKELNESVTFLKANVTQLVADFQGQSKESAAKLQELNTTLRHEFTSEITTLNRADQTIRGNITDLSETHSAKLDLVESELDLDISNLNNFIKRSKKDIENLRMNVRDNRVEMATLRTTVNNHNTYINGNFSYINATLTKLNTTLKELNTTLTQLNDRVRNLNICNCPCNCP